MTSKKNSPEYWEKRIAAHTWEVYNSSEEKNRRLLEMYKDASQAVTNELYRLAEKLQKQGFTRTDTWRDNQLVKLNEEFLNEIKKLGGDVEEFSQESMYDAFRENYERIAEALGGVDVVLPSKKAMEKMMREPWRGGDFSSRLWKNTKQLATVLNDTLRHGVQQGKNVTEIAVELDAKMQQGFHAAHRLARTETMHVLNVSSLEGYKAAKIEKVQFWAAEDERTCELCGKLHGKVYDFNNAPVLPMHPNCRCTYLPVIENSNSADKSLHTPLKKGGHLGSGTDGENVSNKKTSIGQIDMGHLHEAIRYFESQIREKSVEYAFVIERNGEVYQFVGGEGAVDIYEVDLDGAVITHNHPMSQGILSFGKDDFLFLQEHPEIREMRCCNEKYDYSVKLLKPLKDVVYNEIYTEGFQYYGEDDFEAQDAAFRVLKERGYVEYEKKRIAD